ncbi:MAG: hypothetical protein KIS67_25210 [Verrucomicrobiae bacterium]|nr:hypothetical protein [Verrucomicrobiae bacterium]
MVRKAGWFCVMWLLCLAGWLLPWMGQGTEVRVERWRWSNPLPHGNHVLDMLVATDLNVQVGDGGTVYVQRGGERWAPALTGVTNYLRSIAWLDERLIVSGENGCILWSDDGRVFQPAALSPLTLDWFEGVTASAQRAVAVGDNGSIYTSTNGVAWAKVSSGTTEWLRGVAFGGVFVAVGENGKILRSSNGTAWNSITSGTSRHLNRVRYFGNSGSGYFVVVGNNGVALTSSNGNAPWTSLDTGTTNHLYDVALNDTGLLLVGDQEIRFRPTGGSSWMNQIDELSTNGPPAWVYLSAYGTTNYFLVAGRSGLLVAGSRPNGVSLYDWQLQPDSSHAWLWDLTVQRGIYVAVGDLATILTSLDGILWAREVVPLPSTNTVLLGVGGNTNALLAVGNAGVALISHAGLTNLPVTNYIGTNIVITNTTFDPLGLIWTKVPEFTTNTLQGVAAGNDRLILSGDRGSIFVSADGLNWTSRPTATTNFLSGVAISPDACVAVGDRGTLLRTDAHADSWTGITLNTTNWLYRVRWVGGQFVVVGQNGTILTSLTGTHWTVRPSGTTAWLNDVTFADGCWYVPGMKGLLLTSTNLEHWTARPLPSGKSHFGAATWDGRLLLAGVEGNVLRNQVVPCLTPVSFLGYDRVVYDAANGQGPSVPTALELFLFGGEPDQFFEFQSCTNLATDLWRTHTGLELFDPSGTIYLTRERDLTNAPPQEFYRTRLLP